MGKNLNKKTQSNRESLQPVFTIKTLVVALAISITTVIVYLPSLNNGFVYWDDPLYITDNRAIRSFDLNFIKWSFGFQNSNWHPLTWISHAIDYYLWGLNPWGHHLGNIILHSLNAALVFILVYQLAQSHYTLHSKHEAVLNRKIIFLSAITASLFALHPQHVESVAWASERKDLLCAFFTLLCLLYYVRYDKLQTAKAYMYVLSLFFFILALMSKPMAVTVPLIMILFDLYPLNRINIALGLKNRPVLLYEKLPFVVLTIALSVITILAQKQAIASLETISLYSRFVVALNSYIFYLGKLFLPLNLSPFYPYPESVSFFEPKSFISFVFFVAISSLSVIAWKRGIKIFLTGWVFYLLTLLPVIGIIQIGHQAAADRYTYLPTLGIFLMLSSLFIWFYQRMTYQRLAKILLSTTLFIVLSTLAFLTSRQINVWKDSLSLWTAAAINPHPLIYHRLASAYEEKGDYKEAIENLKKALALKPDYFDALINKAGYHAALGQQREAIENIDRAIELNPLSFLAYLNKCNIHLKAIQYTEAIDSCTKAIAIIPENTPRSNNIPPNIQYDYASAYFARAMAYKAKKLYTEALDDFTKSIAITPHLPSAFNERALLLALLNRHEEAIRDFTKAIELMPKYAEAYYNRGATLYRMGKTEDALTDFKRAARLGNRQVIEILKSRGIEP